MEQPEEDFDRLRKLLALKRHEAPPPGYFENFSSKIVARIEAGETAATAPWWKKIVPSFDASPGMAGAYGVIVASFVIFGVNLANTLGAVPAIFKSLERLGRCSLNLIRKRWAWKMII